MPRTSNWGAYWFRKNGRKWDRKFFNEQPWCGGGGVNRWDLFKHNRETKSAWVGTALQRGQLVTWQTITFIYNFSFWKSSSLMTFFCRSFGGFGFWLLIMFGPLTLCFIISYVVHLVHVSNFSNRYHTYQIKTYPIILLFWPTVCGFQVMKLVRMRQQGLDDDFEGKTYSRVSCLAVNWISYFLDAGKRDAQHERVGTAEHDLSPCEAWGWVWGSQASVDKLLGSRSVQSFYAWRRRAKEIYKWDEGNGRKICKRFASEKTTFMWGLGTNWMITSKHLSMWDEAALGRIGGSF